MTLRIVFAGTPVFSASCLQALLSDARFDVVGVVSQPDRKSGRGMKLTPSPVKQLALQYNIDVITPERLRGDESSLAWLHEKECDMLVVVAFGMILPKSWLDAPAIAPINVHASLLPRWRGAAPIERAMLAGDEVTGVNIMQMEEGLDTGDVYASSAIEIGATMLGGALWAALSEVGNALLLDSLPKIAAGELQPVPQDDSQAIYAKKITNDERVVNWQLSAQQLDRYVRVFSPKPGMRALLQGKWLKIIAGAPIDDVTSLQACGAILSLQPFTVMCGDGSAYEIEKVQPEGKQVMGIRDYLLGAKLQIGDQFE
ncbi:MAG: methionyl-tRNA formyltransferase [Zetaproteobacteria bacterium]|nr:methionyl-tRNA formyltransferase [Zetaproteobacteria bacterium]